MKTNFKKNSQICMVFDRIQPEYVVNVCLSTLSDLYCYYFLVTMILSLLFNNNVIFASEMLVDPDSAYAARGQCIVSRSE